MAQLPRAANTEDNSATMDDYSAIPAGEGLAHIIESGYHETKKKNGHYLKLRVQILDGENKGRLLFENLNLDNPNPIAVEIANKTLNTICVACEKVGVQDSEELHGIPMFIKWNYKEGDATIAASNDITFYAPATEAVAQDAGAAEVVNSPSGASAKPTAKKALPWE